MRHQNPHLPPFNLYDLRIHKGDFFTLLDF